MSKQIQEAYIVAATRTPVGKAPKGVFRNTRPDDMLAHVLKAVVAQAPGIDVSRIDDAIIGCAMPEGEQGMNVARIGLLLAGLPNTIAAQDRKSTRLNSSHLVISYAVFCLKKETRHEQYPVLRHNDHQRGS